MEQQYENEETEVIDRVEYSEEIVEEFVMDQNEMHELIVMMDSETMQLGKYFKIKDEKQIKILFGLEKMLIDLSLGTDSIINKLKTEFSYDSKKFVMHDFLKHYSQNILVPGLLDKNNHSSFTTIFEKSLKAYIYLNSLENLGADLEYIMQIIFLMNNFNERMFTVNNNRIIALVENSLTKIINGDKTLHKKNFDKYNLKEQTHAVFVLFESCANNHCKEAFKEKRYFDSFLEYLQKFLKGHLNEESLDISNWNYSDKETFRKLFNIFSLKRQEWIDLSREKITKKILQYSQYMQDNEYDKLEKFDTKLGFRHFWYIFLKENISQVISSDIKNKQDFICDWYGEESEIYCNNFIQKCSMNESEAEYFKMISKLIFNSISQHFSKASIQFVDKLEKFIGDEKQKIRDKIKQGKSPNMDEIEKGFMKFYHENIKLVLPTKREEEFKLIYGEIFKDLKNYQKSKYLFENTVLDLILNFILIILQIQRKFYIMKFKSHLKKYICKVNRKNCQEWNEKEIAEYIDKNLFKNMASPIPSVNIIESATKGTKIDDSSFMQHDYNYILQIVRAIKEQLDTISVNEFEFGIEDFFENLQKEIDDIKKMDIDNLEQKYKRNDQEWSLRGTLINIWESYFEDGGKFKIFKNEKSFMILKESITSMRKNGLENLAGDENEDKDVIERILKMITTFLADYSRILINNLTKKTNCMKNNNKIELSKRDVKEVGQRYHTFKKSWQDYFSTDVSKLFTDSNKHREYYIIYTTYLKNRDIKIFNEAIQKISDENDREVCNESFKVILESVDEEERKLKDYINNLLNKFQLAIASNNQEQKTEAMKILGHTDCTFENLKAGLEDIHKEYVIELLKPEDRGAVDNDLKKIYSYDFDDSHVFTYNDQFAAFLCSKIFVIFTKFKYHSQLREIKQFINYLNSTITFTPGKLIRVDWQGNDIKEYIKKLRFINFVQPSLKIEYQANLDSVADLEADKKDDNISKDIVLHQLFDLVSKKKSKVIAYNKDCDLQEAREKVVEECEKLKNIDLDNLATEFENYGFTYDPNISHSSNIIRFIIHLTENNFARFFSNQQNRLKLIGCLKDSTITKKINFNIENIDDKNDKNLVKTIITNAQNTITRTREAERLKKIQDMKNYGSSLEESSTKDNTKSSAKVVFEHYRGIKKSWQDYFSTDVSKLFTDSNKHREYYIIYTTYLKNRDIKIFNEAIQKISDENDREVCNESFKVILESVDEEERKLKDYINNLLNKFQLAIASNNQEQKTEAMKILGHTDCTFENLKAGLQDIHNEYVVELLKSEDCDAVNNDLKKIYSYDFDDSPVFTHKDDFARSYAMLILNVFLTFRKHLLSVEFDAFSKSLTNLVHDFQEKYPNDNNFNYDYSGIINVTRGNLQKYLTSKQFNTFCKNLDEKIIDSSKDLPCHLFFSNMFVNKLNDYNRTISNFKINMNNKNIRMSHLTGFFSSIAQTDINNIVIFKTDNGRFCLNDEKFFFVKSEDLSKDDDYKEIDEKDLNGVYKVIEYYYVVICYLIDQLKAVMNEENFDELKNSIRDYMRKGIVNKNLTPKTSKELYEMFIKAWNERIDHCQKSILDLMGTLSPILVKSSLDVIKVQFEKFGIEYKKSPDNLYDIWKSVWDGYISHGILAKDSNSYFHLLKSYKGKCFADDAVTTLKNVKHPKDKEFLTSIFSLIHKFNIDHEQHRKNTKFMDDLSTFSEGFLESISLDDYNQVRGTKSYLEKKQDEIIEFVGKKLSNDSDEYKITVEILKGAKAMRTNPEKSIEHFVEIINKLRDSMVSLIQHVYLADLKNHSNQKWENGGNLVEYSSEIIKRAVRNFKTLIENSDLSEFIKNVDDCLDLNKDIKPKDNGKYTFYKNVLISCYNYKINYLNYRNQFFETEIPKIFNQKYKELIGYDFVTLVHYFADKKVNFHHKNLRIIIIEDLKLFVKERFEGYFLVKDDSYKYVIKYLDSISTNETTKDERNSSPDSSFIINLINESIKIINELLEKISQKAINHIRSLVSFNDHSTLKKKIKELKLIQPSGEISIQGFWKYYFLNYYSKILNSTSDKYFDYINKNEFAKITDETDNSLCQSFLNYMSQSISLFRAECFESILNNFENELKKFTNENDDKSLDDLCTNFYTAIKSYVGDGDMKTIKTIVDEICELKFDKNYDNLNKKITAIPENDYLLQILLYINKIKLQLLYRQQKVEFKRFEKFIQDLYPDKLDESHVWNPEKIKKYIVDNKLINFNPQWVRDTWNNFFDLIDKSDIFEIENANNIIEFIFICDMSSTINRIKIKFFRLKTKNEQNNLLENIDGILGMISTSDLVYTLNNVKYELSKNEMPEIIKFLKIYLTAYNCVNNPKNIDIFVQQFDDLLETNDLCKNIPDPEDNVFLNKFTQKCRGKIKELSKLKDQESSLETITIGLNTDMSSEDIAKKLNVKVTDSNMTIVEIFRVYFTREYSKHLSSLDKAEEYYKIIESYDGEEDSERYLMRQLASLDQRDKSLVLPIFTTILTFVTINKVKKQMFSTIGISDFISAYTRGSEKELKRILSITSIPKNSANKLDRRKLFTIYYEKHIMPQLGEEDKQLFENHYYPILDGSFEIDFKTLKLEKSSMEILKILCDFIKVDSSLFCEIELFKQLLKSLETTSDYNKVLSNYFSDNLNKYKSLSGFTVFERLFDKYVTTEFTGEIPDEDKKILDPSMKRILKLLQSFMTTRKLGKNNYKAILYEFELKIEEYYLENKNPNEEGFRQHILGLSLDLKSHISNHHQERYVGEIESFIMEKTKFCARFYENVDLIRRIKLIIRTHLIIFLQHMCELYLKTIAEECEAIKDIRVIQKFAKQHEIQLTEENNENSETSKELKEQMVLKVVKEFLLKFYVKYVEYLIYEAKLPMRNHFSGGVINTNSIKRIDYNFCMNIYKLVNRIYKVYSVSAENASQDEFLRIVENIFSDLMNAMSDKDLKEVFDFNIYIHEYDVNTKGKTIENLKERAENVLQNIDKKAKQVLVLKDTVLGRIDGLTELKKFKSQLSILNINYERFAESKKPHIKKYADLVFEFIVVFFGLPSDVFSNTESKFIIDKVLRNHLKQIFVLSSIHQIKLYYTKYQVKFNGNGNLYALKWLIGELVKEKKENVIKFITDYLSGDIKDLEFKEKLGVEFSLIYEIVREMYHAYGIAVKIFHENAKKKIQTN